MPALFGDERDLIIKKFNQLEAYCGTGKGITCYGGQLVFVDFPPDNPFARFKVRRREEEDEELSQGGQEMGQWANINNNA